MGLERFSARSAHAVESSATISVSQADGGRDGGPMPGDIDLTVLNDRRKQAQRELSAVRESISSESAAGAVQEEQLERQALLEQIVRGYDEQLSNIGRLSASRLGMTPDVANLVRQRSQAFLITSLMLLSVT